MGCVQSQKDGTQNESQLRRMLQSEKMGLTGLADFTLAFGLKSGSDEPATLDLDSEERRLLKVTLCGCVLDQCPDFYQRIWTDSIRKAPEIAEILGLNSRFDPDDATPHEMARILLFVRQIDSFFERLFYEYNLRPQMVSDMCFALGEYHYNLAERGLEPKHFDVFFACLNEQIASLSMEDREGEQLVKSGWRKLSAFIVHRMQEGFESEKMNANQSCSVRDSVLQEESHISESNSQELSSS